MQKFLHENYDLNDPSVVSIIDELPLWSAPFGLKLLETIILKPKLKVLDIGCGTGFPLIELANRLGNSCHLFGIDPWEQAIERIKLKIKIQNLTNVALINCKAEKMPFGDEFFHLIVSNNGINNVDDPQLVLTECYRVSVRKAQMIVTMNLPGTMREFYQVFEETLKEQAKTSEILKLRDHIHKKRKPLDTTVNMIKQAGFSVIRIHEDFFNMRYLDGAAMLNHFFIKLAFLEAWKELLPPEDVEPLFSILEKKLNSIGKQYGGVNFTIPYVCIDCQRN